jgi:hypothetical protein
MGILYKDEDTVQLESNSVARDVPVQQPAPLFVIRPSRRPRKRTHRSMWRNLPLYLSLSDLSTDTDIIRLLSPSTLYTSTIQHRETLTDIAQSLPPTLALGSSHFLDNISLSHHDFDSGDWTFIHTAPHDPLVSSPSSEPETWILLSDDS